MKNRSFCHQSLNLLMLPEREGNSANKNNRQCPGFQFCHHLSSISNGTTAANDPKLSDPARGTRGLQLQRDGRVRRCSEWLAGMVILPWPTRPPVSAPYHPNLCYWFGKQRDTSSTLVQFPWSLRHRD